MSEESVKTAVQEEEVADVTADDYVRLREAMAGNMTIDNHGRLRVRTVRSSDPESGVSLRKRRAWYMPRHQQPRTDSLNQLHKLIVLADQTSRAINTFEDNEDWSIAPELMVDRDEKFARLEKAWDEVQKDVPESMYQWYSDLLKLILSADI